VFGEEGRAGLIWIGEGHYSSTRAFIREADDMGISRRITSIPRGFEVGVTWVFLAHPKGMLKLVDGPPDGLFDKEPQHRPAIFMAFKPSKIERIVKQSDYDTHQEIAEWFTKQPDAETVDCRKAARKAFPKFSVFEKLERDLDRGITLVPVPDNDKDHQR
jgi:hypothetical protein